MDRGQITYVCFRGKKRTNNQQTGAPLPFADWQEADVLKCGGPMVDDPNANTVYELRRGEMYMLPDHVRNVIMRDHSVELDEIVIPVLTPNATTPAPVGRAVYDPVTFKRVSFRCYAVGAPQEEPSAPVAQTPEEVHQEKVDEARGFLSERQAVKANLIDSGKMELALLITNKTTKEELDVIRARSASMAG